MKRPLILVLFACLGLAGCSRSADPLEWKIQGGDPAELGYWLDKNIWSMPAGLAGELSVCLNNIRADTPLGPTGKQQDFRFCQRIDGRTVREVLIAGHELANRMLAARINNESDVVVRLLSTADTLGPEELKQREALMNAHLAVKGTWEQRLKQGETRLAGRRARPISPATPP